MTNREIFAKMTLTCAKVAKLQKEQNEAIEVIKDCFCKTGIMYHPANEPPPETAPKYDTCRKFRAGDIVEFDTHGRDISESMKKAGVTLGERYTVTEDENNTGSVPFIGADGIEHHAMFFWLKLVTPVEELEPYSVVDAHTHWDVVDEDMKTVATYSKGYHPHAKLAAEAERDRLNAEHRKEREK
jgi:hypothetical protein